MKHPFLRTGTCLTSRVVMAPDNITRLADRRQKKAGDGYRMVNRGNGRGEIYVYGIIGTDWFGDGVTAKQFADDLKKLGSVTTIDLRINSDGGLVTDARAMYNLLVEHKAKVISHIDGIAASAASFLAMAGEEIEIAEGGFLMIHNARMGVWGEASDLERGAEVLRTVNETIVSTYQARTKNKAEDIRKWMDAETWFDGNEAVKNGFADRVVANNAKVAAALTDASKFRHVPKALLPRRAAALAKLEKLRQR